MAVTAAAATAAAVGIGAGKLDTCIVFGGDTAYNAVTSIIFHNSHTLVIPATIMFTILLC